MKTPKPTSAKKKSAAPMRGDKLAAELRAEANHLTDAERDQAGKEFLKLFYGATESATTRGR